MINAVKRFKILILYFLVNTRDDVMLTGAHSRPTGEKNILKMCVTGRNTDFINGNLGGVGDKKVQTRYIVELF